MSTTEYIAIGLVVGPLAIYLAVRLATAAFFKSKQTYDQQRKDHGRPPTRHE